VIVTRRPGGFVAHSSGRSISANSSRIGSCKSGNIIGEYTSVPPILVYPPAPSYASALRFS
jgi:hypothetical protein